ncbi:hypothetical protein ACUSIJ_20480 [Pseudochelatococcus sp. B33]
MVSRRHFLHGLLLAGVAAPLAGVAAIGEAQAQQGPGPRPPGGPGGRPGRAPPPPRQERRPPPRAGYVWVPGFWAWDQRRRNYVWTPGQWTRQRAGWRHRNPQWTRRGNQWVFDPGGWYR